ncbi:MAG: hypothetical protein HZB99_00945 [Candidatus Harrisonbacteria bacterium]|nr:hypothetical protein [Candidatus Harrisonbacteria bacterium]
MPIFRTKNENFFKKWSPEMAYVLGFFAADGNLTLGKRGNHYLEFTSTDKDILEKIKRYLNSNHKISSQKRRENWKTIYRIQIGSKEMFNDLFSLGFWPNKSKTLTYPKIPNKYFKHFVRGYFDGDGHVTKGIYKKKGRSAFSKLIFSGFTSGTRNFLEQLKNNLIKLHIIKGGTLYYSKGFRLNFSINDSLSLYKFLYKDLDSDLYLTRKKKIFESYLRYGSYAVVA